MDRDIDIAAIVWETMISCLSPGHKMSEVVLVSGSCQSHGIQVMSEAYHQIDSYSVSDEDQHG